MGLVVLAGFEHGDDLAQVFARKVKQRDFVGLFAVVSQVPVVGEGLGVVHECTQADLIHGGAC